MYAYNLKEKFNKIELRVESAGRGDTCIRDLKKDEHPVAKMVVDLDKKSCKTFNVLKR